MAQIEIDGAAAPGDEPVARIGSRFLPLPAALLPPVLDPTPGVIDLPVPPGTPVHAVTAGRVTHAEGASVGEVVVRGEGGTRWHYRRLLPSTVTVSDGQPVEAGSVLGLVASSPDTAALGFGIQFSDGTWDDAAERLVGLADPSELYLLPPVAGDAGLVAELPSQRRPARSRVPRDTGPATRRPTRRAATPAPTANTEPDLAVRAASSPTSDRETTSSAPTAAPQDRSATDRLTRRRSRSGSTPSPQPNTTQPNTTQPNTTQPTTPTGPAGADQPAVASDEPDLSSPDADAAAPGGPRVEPSPPAETEERSATSPTSGDVDTEGDTPEADAKKAAAMLVGRRRRPRGTR